ncbi:MAG: DNA polymerase III subunit delta [Phycisphaerales bacterium]|nr:DNA polymerase III subunit delta [Phycisphaerales bacterium]
MAKQTRPPIIVVFGDESFQISQTISRRLDAVLPPEVDRGMAITAYDGALGEDAGGPSLAAVMDDLRTPSFFAAVRVVIIRDADKFVTAYREALEAYLEQPSPSGVLLLEVKSFPKTTRLYKRAIEIGGEVIECRRLAERDLPEFVIGAAHALGKKLRPAVAARLVQLIGSDQGLLTNETQKLAIYVGDNAEIADADVTALVGQSREEKIFSVMDAAGQGRLDEAMRLYRQALLSDPAAVFKAVGGVAFVLRRWLTAHEMLESGMSPRAVAPKVMMWGRENELREIMQRAPKSRVRRALAELAELDAQAKVGARSIEAGLESLLARIAS